MTGPSFSAEQVLQLEESTAKGVRKALSDIGLGYDNETEKKAIRADFEFTRTSRLAAQERDQDRWKGARTGFWTVAGIAGGSGLLYLFLHLADFGHFLITIASAAK